VTSIAHNLRSHAQVTPFLPGPHHSRARLPGTGRSQCARARPSPGGRV